MEVQFNHYFVQLQQSGEALNIEESAYEFSKFLFLQRNVNPHQHVLFERTLNSDEGNEYIFSDSSSANFRHYESTLDFHIFDKGYICTNVDLVGRCC